MEERDRRMGRGGDDNGAGAETEMVERQTK